MSKRLSVFLTIVVFYLALNVSAVSKSEADSYYEAAKAYYEKDDYTNALRDVHNAREIYSELGDVDGVIKCDELLSKIEKAITPQKKADTYYDLAGDYFIAAEEQTLDSEKVSYYEKAKLFAQYAKDAYDELKDSRGAIKANDLLEASTRNIALITSTKRELAERTYDSAQSFFLSGDYVSAVEYAKNASQLFVEISDANGITKTATLIKNSEEKIEEIRKNAIASYDLAVDFYITGNNTQSLVYAQNAKTLYQKIRDTEGSTKAQNLINDINKLIGDYEDQQRRLAMRYYQDAEDYLIAMKCENATASVMNARDIYTQFYAAASQIKNPEEKKAKQKLYWGFISECDALFSKIKSACGELRLKQQAEDYFSKAQGYFSHADYDDSLTYARRALSIYQEIENFVGISKTESLLNEINAGVEKKKQADEYLKKAEEYFRTADFENAKAFALSAKKIYDDIWSNRSLECDTLFEKISKGVKQKETADAYFKSAKNYFDNERYNDAVVYAEKALEIYSAINYTQGRNMTYSILTESKARDYAAYRFKRNLVLSVAGVIVLVALVAMLMRSKEERTEVEMLKKQREEEEKRKRELEMQRLEQEVKTEKRVKEELHRLLEEEHEKVEGTEGAVEGSTEEKK